MGRLRWWAGVFLGIAVMAVAGYLVAALVLFPAPLLPASRAVPRLVGLREDEARRELGRAELAVRIIRVPHAAVTVGLVAWQDPPSGVALLRGDTVELTVSTGAPRVAVPDLSGLDWTLATRFLSAVGLGVQYADSVDAPNAAPGTVVASEPTGGDSVPPGRGIVLHLAR